MERSAQRSFLSVSTIIVLGVILLFLNAIGQFFFRSLYVDLTDEKLYSLSQGTRNILASVQDPIRLRFYFSQTDATKYPALRLYGERVKDLLQEYERLGAGNVVLEIHDPRPDTEAEEWAQKYGINPIPLRTGESLYFGLAGVNGVGDEETIPVFNLQRQESLEYDITKLVFSLTGQEKPTVGVLSSLDVRGLSKMLQQQQMQRPPQDQSWFFTQQLEGLANVEFLEPDLKEIDDSVDVVLLIHPKVFPNTVLYALDQFVMRGGKLMVFVDPYCEADQPVGPQQNPMQVAMADRSSNIKELLDKWGVALQENNVIADGTLATKVAVRQGGLAQNFVVWLTLNKDAFSGDNVVTNALDTMVVPWAGALEVTPIEGIESEVLLQSTKTATLVPKKDYSFQGGQPEKLLMNYGDGDEQFPIAVRLSGTFTSNFPQGPPKLPEEGEDPAASNMSVAAPEGHLAKSSGTSNVVVVADVDFMTDRFSIQAANFFGRRLVTMMNDNLVFLQNMIENLSGSTDLISIRSRGKFTRPFTRVKDIERRAQERWRAEELRLQAKLNGANQRLTQLTSANQGKQGKQVFSQAVLDEIKQFREERKQAQQKLRDVRRKLREDKEGLGTKLFLLNTFLVPILLILLSVGILIIRKRTNKASNS